MKIIKPLGVSSSEARRGTMHGSHYEKRLASMQGNDNLRDGKPKGFLSRNNGGPRNRGK